jgi:hypothetical protein
LGIIYLLEFSEKINFLGASLKLSLFLFGAVIDLVMVIPNKN